MSIPIKIQQASHVKSDLDEYEKSGSHKNDSDFLNAKIEECIVDNLLLLLDMDLIHLANFMSYSFI